MAYQPENLSALSYANGFTLWHYRTSDPAADVDTAGYFDGAVRMLRVGDFVFLNAGIGVAPASGVMIVASNNGLSVDVTTFTPFGVSNSD
ncbi:MAG TPA: hypothetical protein PKA13_12710 [Geminicoccaceae bacterium]|nr:hypothetical protein [Geminicoccus sp.]HMU50628.1 hypothetical protein [Geminicoccaceae bacterium]